MTWNTSLATMRLPPQFRWRPLGKSEFTSPSSSEEDTHSLPLLASGSPMGNLIFYLHLAGARWCPNCCQSSKGVSLCVVAGIALHGYSGVAFIPSSIDRHLGCLQFWATVNDIVMKFLSETVYYFYL